MISYGNVHRRFLQSFLYHPTQTEEELIRTYKLCCEEQEQDSSEKSIEEVIEKVNRVLRSHTSLEIKSAICELTGTKYYVSTNTANMSWSKNTSLYSKNEQVLFKKVMDEIMKSEEGYASSIVCLNNTGSNISKGDATKSISKFIDDGWFSEKEGHIYVGVRSAAELEPLILDSYDGATSQCPLCKKLIFWGYRCESCSEVTHIHCLKRFFSSSGSNGICPSCNIEWTDWERDLPS